VPIPAPPAGASTAGASTPAADDRYSRHRAIEGFAQEALQAGRYLVVGAGAIGNEVVKNLCLLGVGRIDVFDFDRVELHNLTRSVLLRESDIGQPKAAALVARARELDPAVRLQACEGDIRDTLAPHRVVAADLVIGAVDNFEARLWINRVCRLVGRDWVNAAIDHRHASVETFPFASAPVTGCYECGLPDSVHARIAERYSCGGLLRAALAERVMPTTTITASLAGALAVQQALARPGESRRILVDSRTGRSTVAALPQRPDCPGCAGLPGSTGLALTRMPAATGTTLARWVRANAADEPVVLCEPVVWSASCRHCGETDATRALVGRPARLVRDTATFCFACGSESIAPELRDVVDADELARRYGGSPLPLAFVQAGTHLLDLGSD
jgi:molybdopterin/thiamine biosynthesis adenylyltransferase